MKIMILADSRAMWPRERPWPNVLHAVLGPGHEIHTFISGVDDWLISIYRMEEHVVKNFPDVLFDVIIVQTGWHVGGPCFWPASTWEQIVTTSIRKFDKEKLTKRIIHKGQEKFLYHDREADASIFDTLKSRSKHCIFLGMHNLRPPNDLDEDYKLGLDHHYEVLTANHTYMKQVDEFNFPMDNQWKAEACCPDGIHYVDAGVNFLVSYLARFLSRINLTINSIFSNTTKHVDLLEKSKLAGSHISHLTKPNDVVLISGPTGADIIHAFLGCILYGRKPLIIQQPSTKVSEKEFRAKMQEIKQNVNPALCLCTENNQTTFSEFFQSTQIAYTLTADRLHVPSCDDVAFLQL